MGISRTEYMGALGVFPEMAVVANDKDGSVSIIAVPINGVYGGAHHTKSPVTYRLLIDVTNLQSDLPTVWVSSPSDREIAHVNIFHATRHCPITATKLSHLCWGNFGGTWTSWPASQRTLLGLLNLIAQHLTHPYFTSPAR